MEEMTVKDECQLIGAAHVSDKNSRYLLNLINRMVKNFDSCDCDRDTLLLDMQLATDNCRTVIEATELVLQSITLMRQSL
jgi:hypothetical protein